MSSTAQPRRTHRRPPNATRRVRLLLAGCLAMLVIVLLRGLQLQVVDHASYARVASQEHSDTIMLHADRGEIVDRYGRPLAISEQAVTIGAYVPMLHPIEAAQAVARALGIPEGPVYARLTAAVHGHIGHIDLVRQADPVAASRLAATAAGLALTLIPEQKRVYPAQIGTQLVGVTNIDGTGLAGLEVAYNSLLHGSDGVESFNRDATGATISPITLTPAHDGARLELSLDSNLQSAAEQAATATLERQHAQHVTIVMLDPRTGGVLAVASAPGTGTQSYAAATPDAVRIRAITDQYEPGSTFKTVTIAAALARGTVTPDTRFVVPDCIRLYDRTICDAEQHPTEPLSVRDILRMSSNVGAVTIASQDLSGSGPADHGKYLWPYIDTFGFGRRTGIDLPGESPGDVPPYKTWSGTTIGNIPFGQGLAVTPIQLAAFYAMIANGGVWIAPHLVASVGGVPVVAPHRRMLSRSVARDLTSMLEEVVTTQGTGVKATIAHYTVAGKTGTTQKVVNGKYSTTHFVGSFVGFAPAAHPRVVTLVIVDDPATGSYFGGDSAAPVFSALTGRALRLLGVPASN